MRPATEKQVKYIKALLAGFTDEDALDEVVKHLDVRMASELIGRLKYAERNIRYGSTPNDEVMGSVYHIVWKFGRVIPADVIKSLISKYGNDFWKIKFQELGYLITTR